jgi:hypothetical protein
MKKHFIWVVVAAMVMAMTCIGCSSPSSGSGDNNGGGGTPPVVKSLKVTIDGTEYDFSGGAVTKTLAGEYKYTPTPPSASALPAKFATVAVMPSGSGYYMTLILYQYKDLTSTPPSATYVINPMPTGSCQVPASSGDTMTVTYSSAGGVSPTSTIGSPTGALLLTKVEVSAVM